MLHVGTLTERAFDDEDVELLQRAGDRAALAISSRLTERERGLADALQRSLMPRLPELPAVSLAGPIPAGGGRPARRRLVRRVRARRTAGSAWRSATWSAAASTPRRSWASSAAACAHTRSTASAPSDVLERLSRLLRQLEPGRTATVVYLVLDPHGGGLTVAERGPPAAARAQRPAMSRRCSSCRARCRSAPPATCATRTTSWSWSPARCCVLYTDGFVERRERAAGRRAWTG